MGSYAFYRACDYRRKESRKHKVLAVAEEVLDMSGTLECMRCLRVYPKGMDHCPNCAPTEKPQGAGALPPRVREYFTRGLKKVFYSVDSPEFEDCNKDWLGREYLSLAEHVALLYAADRKARAEAFKWAEAAALKVAKSKSNAGNPEAIGSACALAMTFNEKAKAAREKTV